MKSVASRLNKLEEQSGHKQMFAIYVEKGEPSGPVIDAYCKDHNISDAERDSALWLTFSNYK
ncbi:MAG: hypothetical protein AAF387_15185 [Pseudomonadota bacterium]